MVIFEAIAYGLLDLKPLDARRPQKGMAHDAKPTTASMALASMDFEIYGSVDVGSSNPWPGKFPPKNNKVDSERIIWTPLPFNTKKRNWFLDRILHVSNIYELNGSSWLLWST